MPAVNAVHRAEAAVPPRTAEASAGREVEARRTPLSPSEVRASTAAAYRAIHGAEIPDRTLDVLSAQACTETACGASMYNYNFGGIKGTSPEGATARLKTREILDGREVTIRDGFRAYSSAVAGATDYLALLEHRFPAAMEAARAGDVEGFVRELKAGRYFTADAGQYAAALRGLVDRGMDGTTVDPSALAMKTPMRSITVEPGVVLSSPYPTALAVARVMDAVNGMSSSIAAPNPRSEEP